MNNIKARARVSDPMTSHLAAAEHELSGKAATHRELCLKAVRKYPGLTSFEIDNALGVNEVAHRRLPELRKMGLIKNGLARKCRIKNTMCMTWWPYETNL